MKREFESVLLMVDMCLPDESIDGGRATADYKKEVEDHLKNGGQLIFIQMMASEPGRPQGLEKLDPKQWDNSHGTREGPALMSLHFKQDYPQAPDHEATRLWLSNLLKNGVSDGINGPKMLTEGQVCLCAKSLKSALLSKKEMPVQLALDIQNGDIRKDSTDTPEKVAKLNSDICGSGHNGRYLVDELMDNKQLKEIKIAGANLTHCVSATFLQACQLFPKPILVRVLPHVVFDADLNEHGERKVDNANIYTPDCRMKTEDVFRVLKESLKGVHVALERVDETKNSFEIKPLDRAISSRRSTQPNDQNVVSTSPKGPS